MEKKTVWIVAIFITLVLMLLIGERYFGYVFYPGAGYGYGGYFGSGGYLGESFLDIIGFYYSYQTWFDFFIFLSIFLGLAKTVFGGKGAGGTAIYTGIGIFLALGLVIWEQQTGFSLLTMLGPIIFMILILLLCFVVYRLTADLTGVTLLAVGLAITTFGLFFYWVMGGYYGGYYGGGFLYDLIASFPFPISSTVGIIIGVGGILMTVFGLFRWATGGGH